MCVERSDVHVHVKKRKEESRRLRGSEANHAKI
jgi:hypothetical protein